MSDDLTFPQMEHSVYLGRERLGRYERTGPKRFVAIDADDRLLGDFKRQKTAYAAISAGRQEASR